MHKGQEQLGEIALRPLDPLAEPEATPTPGRPAPAHLSWGGASRESKLLGLWEESVAGKRGTRILKTGNVWRAVTKPYCRSGTEPHAEDRLSHQDWGRPASSFLDPPSGGAHSEAVDTTVHHCFPEGSALCRVWERVLN